MSENIKIRRGKVQERIIRVLLNEPDGTLSKYRVMKLANGSQTWVYDYLKRLEHFEILEGTKVKDFNGLFNAWLKIRKIPEKKEYLIKNPLSTLKYTNLNYALTTYQAENIVQNFLFPTRTDIYINKNDEYPWHEILSNEGLVGKGNFRLLFDDDHVFYNILEKKDLKIVSIPQLIVDLYMEGVVCVEAADMLLRKMVKKYVQLK